MASTGAMSTILLSSSEREFVKGGCRDNCRLDGRTRTEFRKYVLEATTCSSATSNGSARIVGTTAADPLHLTCHVKADVVPPAPYKPKCGIVTVTVDTFAPDVPRSFLDQVQEALHQLVLPHVVDLTALCIIPNVAVWRLQIDLYSLSTPIGKGAFLDAASHVLRAALQRTILPCVTIAPTAPSSPTAVTSLEQQLVVDSDYQKGVVPSGVESAPVIVTITLLLVGSLSLKVPQTVLLLDATAQEEAAAYAQIHVSIAHNEVCGVRLSGNQGSVPVSLLPDCMALALRAYDTSLPSAFLLAKEVSDRLWTDVYTFL